MYKFIKKTFIFSLIFVLLVAPIDIWLRSQDLSYKVKYDGFVKVKDSVELIILGNSHANSGLNPSEFKDIYAYKLSNSGQKIYQDKRIVLKALSECNSPKLKYVLISVDYHSLFKSTQGERNVWSYYDLGIKYKDQSYFLANISPFLWGYTPIVSLSFLKKKYINKQYYLDKPNSKSPLVKGSLLSDKVVHSSFKDEKYIERIKEFSEDINNSERKEIVADLKDFIKILKEKGITPILFTTPTFTKYNVFLDKDIIKRNNKDLKNICEEFGINYFDFMNDDSFLQKHFFNGDHLNRTGANIFTRKLQEALKLNKGS